ncbi:MAG TPA: hypothetical protein VNO74_04225, partial [Methylomirabilota bacterium]|nr:hypothetical protein [Methylomirabilota bacterium]
MKIVGALAMAVALSALVLAPPAWSSGFHPPMASFVSQYKPDPPLDQFAAGRLGLIQPSWETTYSYVAYRYLAGPGFNADEQKVLLSIWNEPSYPQPNLEPQTDWLAARAKIPGASPMQMIGTFAAGPSYTFFLNCNDDAFRTATATLGTVVAKFGESSAQVKQWLDAQDLVFQNCPGSSSKPNPHIPEPLRGGTRFEQAERAYQIACANFYIQNFDAAVSMFTFIGADSTSPWRTIAPYLVARATIRKATLSGVKNDNVLLAQAETQLNAIVAGSGPDDLKAGARRLLGFVGCRLHPEERNEQEVRAIMRPGSESTLAQDLKDYRECGTPRLVGDFYANDLDDWFASFGPTDDPSHAIDKWKRTQSPAWLLASLAHVSGSDPRAETLIEAAQRLAPDSPAHLTAAFHVARILIEQGKTDEARARLDAILAKPDALPHSAFNQFSRLRLKLARNFGDYLKYAQRYPVTIDGDELPDEFDDPYMQRLAAGPLLDVDSAEVMDQWLPLSVLKESARSQILPSPLRAQVAQSIWMRSILLGDQETARELAPVVRDLIPDLKPSLDAWLAAKDSDQQRFEVALMALRSPGMRPYIDPGIGRPTRLGTMYFRDNWWPALKSVALANAPLPSAGAVTQPAVSKYPSFLSAAERESADREWIKLSANDGPEFLCSEALRHASVSPNDERVPEALYRCVVAVHLGPSSDRCNALAESAFHRLHRRYPNSKWARENN